MAATIEKPCATLNAAWRQTSTMWSFLENCFIRIYYPTINMWTLNTSTSWTQKCAYSRPI